MVRNGYGRLGAEGMCLLVGACVRSVTKKRRGGDECERRGAVWHLLRVWLGESRLCYKDEDKW